jgi:hypothetical protein
MAREEMGMGVVMGREEMEKVVVMGRAGKGTVAQEMEVGMVTVAGMTQRQSCALVGVVVAQEMEVEMVKVVVRPLIPEGLGVMETGCQVVLHTCQS